MKLMRSAVVVGLAKKLVEEGRKPENQARIREAVAKVQARRARGTTHGTTRGSTPPPPPR